MSQGPHGRPRGARAALVTAVLAVVLVGGAVSAAGPAAASESAEVEVRLTDLTGVLAPQTPPDDEEEAPLVTRLLEEEHGPGEDLELRMLVHNRGDAAVDGLRVVVEVHPAVADRDELAAALEGEGPAAVATVHQQDVRDLADLDAGEVAGLEEVLTPEQVPWSPEGGVHPVRISLVRGAEVLDEISTAVVWLGEAEGEPLLTTVVWPVTDKPWRAEQGAYPAGVQRDLRPGGRLDDLVRGLELHEDPGVLLAPSSHLVEDLRDQASGFVRLQRQEDGTRAREEVGPEDDDARRAAQALTRLRELTGGLRHQPVSGAYADADLTALLAHGSDLRELAGELATEGRSRLQRDLEHPVDAAAFVLNRPVTPEVLDLMPSQHLLLAPEVAADPPTDGRVQQLRSPSGRPLTASVGDPTIAQVLADGAGDGLVTAQRVLAETAALYFTEPHVADRSVALHPPDDWDPEPELIDALLRGLDEAPWLQPVDPSRLVGQAERAPGTLELSTPEDERLPHDVAEELSTALDDLHAAVEAWPSQTDDRPEPTRRDMRTALLRAASGRLDPDREATSLIRDVQSSIDRFFGDVEVASGSQVTLTAETGQVPVTVRRSRGGPIAVRVEVESQGRLMWQERRSDPIVLEDEEAHTVSFETRALGTGTFPVTVIVTDVTGTRELERANLRVRSTAVSGPALSATGALVLILLLVGAIRRRPRGPQLQVVDADAAPDEEQPQPDTR